MSRNCIKSISFIFVEKISDEVNGKMSCLLTLLLF